MDEPPRNHATQERGHDDETVLPLAGGNEMVEVHPVDARHEVRHHDDDGDGGQPFHDEAEPIERGENVDVERGAEQVSIGVELCEDVKRVILDIREVRP